MALEIDAAAEIFWPGSCIPHCFLLPTQNAFPLFTTTAESLILFDGVEYGDGRDIDGSKSQCVFSAYSPTSFRATLGNKKRAKNPRTFFGQHILNCWKYLPYEEGPSSAEFA